MDRIGQLKVEFGRQKGEKYAKESQAKPSQAKNANLEEIIGIAHALAVGQKGRCQNGRVPVWVVHAMWGAYCQL
jgi:hypothetical protein